jgi:serine/threonine protein kinase
MPDTPKNDETPQPPPLPQYIGRFHIDGIYSQGGMSTIYLATDPDTHDQIVIKVLLPRFLSDPTLVQQFVNEGRIIAMTDHPNIVKLYEYGEWAGGVYIAMELVRGTSLRRILQYNPMPLKRALEVLLQVCYAIGHLHTHGVIHGDLKPENILITDQNQVKLIDFGISRVVSESPEGPGNTSKRFIGTPIYMSPEAQENPRNSSIQSDIYSIGIVAYELVMGKITHGRVILTLAPRGMQPILQTALQPKPEDRYHDISELITPISDYIHSGTLQKDRQGVDYFFELFAQLETLQKSLLTSLIPQDDSNIGVSMSYGVRLNALYFQCFKQQGEKVVLLAKGDNRGVQGIIDTYCLHTLFESIQSQNPTLPASDLVSLLFQKAGDQGIPFRYSFLSIDPHAKQFSWRQEGWGALFMTTETATRLVQSNPEEQLSFEGSYKPKDRFFIIGNTSATLLEFASTPMVPLHVMLTDAIHSTRNLPCEKQASGILQKLRMRGDCVVDDHPVCLIAINAAEGQ